jgi:16S rRNA U516 pseudouridylate synthase RsuA-like enzyme
MPNAEYDPIEEERLQKVLAAAGVGSRRKRVHLLH